MDVNGDGGVNEKELREWLELGAPSGKTYLRRRKQQAQIAKAFKVCLLLPLLLLLLSPPPPPPPPLYSPSLFAL